MVENQERVESQGDGNVEDYRECPAEPARVYPEKLKSDHQDGAHWAEDHKLPCPVLEKL